jgi:azobenzene reductase
MRILIISGSTRVGRHSHKLAVALQNKLMSKEGGIEADVLDVAAYDIPVFEASFNKHPNPGDVLLELHTILNNADAMVFLSPEYHGSFTGSFKNLIDYYWTEFQKKPIGVATTSTGRFGGINASTEMQQLILSLGAFPMPVKLIVPTVQNVFDEAGNIADEYVIRAMDKFATEFLWFADALISKKKSVV